MEVVSELPKADPLFNSELETGTRAMVILEAAYPRAFDLARLTWFDHLVVHTEDIGGPESLHPALPGRTGFPRSLAVLMTTVTFLSFATSDAPLSSCVMGAGNGFRQKNKRRTTEAYAFAWRVCASAGLNASDRQHLETTA